MWGGSEGVGPRESLSVSPGTLSLFLHLLSLSRPLCPFSLLSVPRPEDVGGRNSGTGVRGLDLVTARDVH